MEPHTHQLTFSIIAILYIITSIIIVVYYAPKRKRKENNVHNEERNGHNGIIHYTCPNCHQQVNNGLATAGRSVIFFIEDLK